MAILEFKPSAIALLMGCLKYVSTSGRCLAIVFAAAIIGGSRLCVAQKYQRFHNATAWRSCRQSHSSRSDSLSAQARAVFKCAPLSMSKRSRDLPGTFSALYNHKYLLLLGVVSPVSSSALFSRFLTLSTASTT